MKRRLITLIAGLALMWAALLPAPALAVTYPPSGCVTLYEKADYVGGSYTTCSSISNFSGLHYDNGVSLNDTVSSYVFSASRTHTNLWMYRNAGYTTPFYDYDQCSATCAIYKLPTTDNDHGSSLILGN